MPIRYSVLNFGEASKKIVVSYRPSITGEKVTVGVASRPPDRLRELETTGRYEVVGTGQGHSPPGFKFLSWLWSDSVTMPQDPVKAEELEDKPVRSVVNKFH